MQAGFIADTPEVGIGLPDGEVGGGEPETDTECWVGHGRGDAWGAGYYRKATAHVGGKWQGGSGDDGSHAWAYANGAWGGKATAVSGPSRSQC